MKLLLVVLALIGIFVLAPASANAYDVIDSGGICSQAPNSAACAGNTKNKNDKTPITSMISKITKLIAIVAGIVAVIMIVVSGLRFIFSGGESNAVTGAKNTLTHAIIGIVIIALASAIISFAMGLI